MYVVTLVNKKSNTDKSFVFVFFFLPYRLLALNLISGVPFFFNGPGALDDDGEEL